MEREGMEGNNLLHFLDTPSAHYRKTCDGFVAERDGDDHSDASAIGFNDREAESGFHATVACPMAAGLRNAMREHWDLPEENQFSYTGPDWLLILFDRWPQVQRDLVKLVLWQAWTAHNNLTHQSGPYSIPESVHSLLAMQSTLAQIQEGSVELSAKGKEACRLSDNRKKNGKENANKPKSSFWKPPPAGWIKINVDGSFVANTGEGGIGIIARDSGGSVLLTAWKPLSRCADAVEAEARACTEGIRSAVEVLQGKVILESDCSRIITALNNREDRSKVGFVLSEAKEMLWLLDDWKLSLVKRECNKVAHELAQLARRNIVPEVWLGRTPACVTELVELDYPPNAREMLEYLLGQPANKVCADCGIPDPKWVALPFGAFICIKCSGTHRSLGVHISKVISVNLDEWTDEEVNCLAESGGNSVVNTRYEAFLPENKKIKQDCATEERNDFIRKKYQFQQFVCDPQFSCPLPLNKRHAQDKQQQHNSNKHGFGHAFRNSWRKKDSDSKGLKKMSDVGMIEFVGLIKVNIVKGTDLAVRDVMSSDPYVMINLGHQSMKTKVIKNTLNPIWNERLMLSIPNPIPPLKLQVFDKDTFSSDDRMGEAEVDIRPLISATKEHENSTLTEWTELYRWSANEDINGVLAKDSLISIANGKVKQEITLKLQNVERGEVEIEIECVPLSQ